MLTIIGIAAIIAVGINQAMKQKQRKRLRTMPYREYLQTMEWQQRAHKARVRAKFRCENPECRSQARLDVHHLTYERRGAERPSDLMALCRPCHEKQHQKS